MQSYSVICEGAYIIGGDDDDDRTLYIVLYMLKPTANFSSEALINYIYKLPVHTI